MAFFSYLASFLRDSEQTKAIKYWQFLEEDNKPQYNKTLDQEDAEFVQLKIDILSKYGVETVRNAWLSVTAALEEETKAIQEQGTKIWPEITFAEIQGSVSDEKKTSIRHRGVVVVRQVFSEEQATSWKDELWKYLQDNPELLAGYPKENPWVYRSYWSPVQLQIRSHDNSLRVQRFLNELWDGYGDGTTASPTPLAYADALRFRQPGGFSAVVQPHIDAGSLDRWGDPDYFAVYDKIFQGKWAEYNPFDISQRQQANFAKYPGPQQSVFRAFQGWTALSPQGGPDFGQSGLAVFPHSQLGIAYVLLRPFFKPPTGGSLDPKLWELDLSDTFPGSKKGESQKVRPITHPHLRLEETLALTPAIRPGDLVFWHCDTVHAVDPLLKAKEPAAVLYIPAVPLTEFNATYAKEQRDTLLDNGKTPPDFQRWWIHHESEAKGWKSATEEIVSRQGLEAFGLQKLSGDEPIVQKANKIWGY